MFVFVAFAVIVVVDDFRGTAFTVSGLAVSAAEAVEQRLHALEHHLAGSDTGCGLHSAAKEAATCGCAVAHRLSVGGWRIASRRIRRGCVVVYGLIRWGLLRLLVQTEKVAEEAAAGFRLLLLAKLIQLSLLGLELLLGLLKAVLLDEDSLCQNVDGVGVAGEPLLKALLGVIVLVRELGVANAFDEFVDHLLFLQCHGVSLLEFRRRFMAFRSIQRDQFDAAVEVRGFLIAAGMKSIVIAEGAGGDATGSDALGDEVLLDDFGAALRKAKGFGAVEIVVGEAVDGKLEGRVCEQDGDNALGIGLALAVACGFIFADREVEPMDDFGAGGERCGEGLLASRIVLAPSLHVGGACEGWLTGEEEREVVEHCLEAGQRARDPTVVAASDGEGEGAGVVGDFAESETHFAVEVDDVRRIELGEGAVKAAVVGRDEVAAAKSGFEGGDGQEPGGELAGVAEHGPRLLAGAGKLALETDFVTAQDFEECRWSHGWSLSIDGMRWAWPGVGAGGDLLLDC